MKHRDQLGTLLSKLAETEADDSRKLDAERASAARALGELGDVAAIPGLVHALSHPNQVCVASALALARIGHVDAVAPLVAVLQDELKFWMARGAAAVALGELGSVAIAALPALESVAAQDMPNATTSWDERAREAALDAISHLKDPAASCALRANGKRYEMWGFG